MDPVGHRILRAEEIDEFALEVESQRLCEAVRHDLKSTFVSVLNLVPQGRSQFEVVEPDRCCSATVP